MNYIVCAKFQGKTLSGVLSLSKSKKLTLEEDGFLYDGSNKLFYKASQNAYDFTARNDDGNGLQRHTLSHSILDMVAQFKLDYGQACAEAVDAVVVGEDMTEEEINQLKAQAVEGIVDKSALFFEALNADETLARLMTDGTWNFEFYNASIEDLERLKAIGEAL